MKGVHFQSQCPLITRTQICIVLVSVSSGSNMCTCRRKDLLLRIDHRLYCRGGGTIRTLGHHEIRGWRKLVEQSICGKALPK